jgi:hypothetical protein
MTEQELYDVLFDKLCTSKDEHYTAAFRFMESGERNWSQKLPKIYEPEAYAELAKDIFFSGHCIMKAGATVRVVMVSTLGDMGITRDLSACYGYEIRVTPGAGYLTNCRLTL